MVQSVLLAVLAGLLVFWATMPRHTASPSPRPVAHDVMWVRGGGPLVPVHRLSEMRGTGWHQSSLSNLGIHATAIKFTVRGKEVTEQEYDAFIASLGL